MTQDQWTAVDNYFGDLLTPADPALDAALQASADAGLPPISVSPLQGRLLELLALTCGARAILELGTLGGYSTIWMARALPAGGKLISLEFEPRHAEVARANLARAGLDGVAEVRVGAALDTLPKLVAEGLGPFDLVFIDADKANTPAYFDWALKLTRRGSLIVVDNVVRDGEVADPANADASVRGIRQFINLAATDPRVRATALQTVGVKGYDGLAIVRVNDER